ncbi:MAG: ABC transporter permease [Chloroflexi bacterium]|nr:ABC transporter permease [Chloroflexota bacterium]
MVVPLLAGGLGLVVGAVMLQLLGASPIDGYIAMAQGAFGRGGVINIGGEGQIVIGALCATAVGLTFQSASAWFLVPAGLLAGFAGGAVWAGIAGVLKINFYVNEVLSTIMLNSIATYVMTFFLNGPIMDPTTLDNAIKIPQTQRLPLAADLARWVPTRLHAGVALAILLAILTYILLWRTTFGYRIRAVGLNARAARYAGISVGRYQILAFLLSGGLAGVGGAAELLGVTHRLFSDGSAQGFTGNAGFNGIVAALFGGLHPIGTIPAAILFGALLVGANSLQRTVQVPSAFVTTLDGLIVVFVVASQIWAQRRSVRVSEEAARKSETEAGSGAAVIPKPPKAEKSGVSK